jgi:hypothetical protein
LYSLLFERRLDLKQNSKAAMCFAESFRLKAIMYIFKEAQL